MIRITCHVPTNNSNICREERKGIIYENISHCAPTRNPVYVNHRPIKFMTPQKQRCKSASQSVGATPSPKQMSTPSSKQQSTPSSKQMSTPSSKQMSTSTSYVNKEGVSSKDCSVLYNTPVRRNYVSRVSHHRTNFYKYIPKVLE